MCREAMDFGGKCDSKAASNIYNFFVLKKPLFSLKIILSWKNWMTLPYLAHIGPFMRDTQ
jgi:hypothetical protein